MWPSFSLSSIVIFLLKLLSFSAFCWILSIEFLIKLKKTLLICSLSLFKIIFSESQNKSISIEWSNSFNNLIYASSSIGEGNFDAKVPEVKTDKDLEILNRNFNLMIDRLKTQQEKLIINERHEAWGSLARKLAHEIRNPLTPIQLTIDRLREKYSNLLKEKDSENFKDNLKIINNQIKQIGNLVNEFSDFARMPKPTLREITLSIYLKRILNY